MTEELLERAVDAAMTEMANIHPPLRRAECERLIRAAIEAIARPEVRNAALEEAALICDAKAKKIDPYMSVGTMGFAARPAFEEAAKAIRSLKQ